MSFRKTRQREFDTYPNLNSTPGAGRCTGSVTSVSRHRREPGRRSASRGDSLIWSIVASTRRRFSPPRSPGLAAGEIRDRVFCDAAKLVLAKAGREKAIRDRRFARSSMSDAEATRLLERLIDDLPALQIRTLDSVFASIAAGLGPESGVPHSARLVEADEAADLLRGAIDHAIDESDEETMLATLETLGRRGTKVTIVPVVERAVGKLLTLHEESTDEAWEWPAPPAG